MSSFAAHSSGGLHFGGVLLELGQLCYLTSIESARAKARFSHPIQFFESCAIVHRTVPILFSL